MDENTSVNVLQQHGIKPTANRILVVKLLAAQRRPVTLRDLDEAILTVDKSNISRVLSLFREKHLVHIIDDGSGLTHYELCLSHGSADDDNHVHFYCEQCHRTYCLYDVPVPQVKVPTGYRPSSASYVISGICAECSKKTKP